MFNFIAFFFFQGGAIAVRPDASGLAALVKKWEQVNHLYIVENFLRRLLSKEAGQKCGLSATLSDNGDISVVLAAIKSQDAGRCMAASKELMETINNPPKKVASNVLKPVAATAKVIPNKGLRTAKIIGTLNTLNQVTDALNKVGELPNKVQTQAKTSLHKGMNTMMKKTDEWEEGISGASISHVCLVTLVITLATGILLTTV